MCGGIDKWGHRCKSLVCTCCIPVERLCETVCSIELSENSNAAPRNATYRYFTNVMLVWAICFTALTSSCKCATHRHAAGIKLVQKATRVALHAQAAQPECAYRLC